MGSTGPWVRGMGTWHHPLVTGSSIYFKKNGPGPVHGTRPLVPILCVNTCESGRHELNYWKINKLNISFDFDDKKTLSNGKSTTLYPPQC